MHLPADNNNGATAQLTAARRATEAALSDSERRRKRRARLAQPVRVRPSEFRENDFDEVLCTRDVCRDGIYFPTQRASYEKGMRLFVTFPYRGPSEMNLEYIGQVVRVDALPGGKFGIAVHLLMTINLKTHGTNDRIDYTSF